MSSTKNLKIKLYMAVLILIGITVYFLLPRFSGETVYIALAGDMTPGCANGLDSRNAVELCLDEINKQGGINGKKIKLRVFNDRNDKQEAIRIASQIAESKDILITLGHELSSVSIPSGRVYKKNGIPAIAGSAMSDAVTKGNDWYFRVVSNTSFQGDYIATYVYNILKHKSTSIVASDTSYGTIIADSFENKAKRLGLEIKNRWNFNGNSNTFDEDITKIIHEIVSMEDPGILYIASEEKYSVTILTQLREAGSKCSLITTDPFSENSMMIFKSLPQEKASPGYFTNGIYTISPILFDIANQKAHIFRKKYLKKYNKEPGWYAAFYYDAANVACEAMKRAEIQGRGHIRRDRREIKKALESMYSLDTGIQGVQGYIYFDENGDSNGPLGIGFYWNQKLLPAFSQYHLKTIPEDDLENGPVGKVLSGEFVMIGDRVMSNKKIVYVGVDINALNGLDMKNLTYYQTDFYLWFRYKGKINGADNIKFADIIEPVNLGNPVSERKYGDITIKTYHVKTEFRGNFDFHDYPFDKHKLKIKFNHKNITRDNIIYVSDILGMSGSEKKDSAIETTDVTGVQGYENIITNVSSLGIPEYFHDRKILNYSQFCAEISIDKDSTDSILRYFLPIIIILLVLYSIYFISVENFFIRLLIPISVLAANAFYHVKLLSDLQVEYITALEYSYFVIYLLIVLGMALVLIINNRLKKEKHKTIKKLLYVGRIIHPLIILISGFLLYF